MFQRLVGTRLTRRSASRDFRMFNSRACVFGGAVSHSTVVPVTLTPLYLEEGFGRCRRGSRSTDQGLCLRDPFLYRRCTLLPDPAVAAPISSAQPDKTACCPGDAIFR